MDLNPEKARGQNNLSAVPVAVHRVRFPTQNMKDRNAIKYIGRVIEKLPNLEFKVEVHDNPNEAGVSVMRCILSGRMKLHKISVSIGDRVEFEPAGHLGRIIKRL